MKIRSTLSDIYFAIFSLGAFEKVNDMMLELAIRARGYNNYKNRKMSGEEFFIDKVLSRLNPGVCIDVGANVGHYSRILLEKTSAKVFAFEPLAKPFLDLRKLGEVFGDRFLAVNKGVGSKNEVLSIHYSDDASEHASFSEEIKNVPYIRNELAQEIEVVTLDSFFLNCSDIRAIDFLKIDTEGFEFDVLLGATALIEKFKPRMIQMEYNWHQLFKSQSLYSISMLLSDYQTFQLLPDRLAKRDPKDPFANIYHFSNFVFVRKDCTELVGCGR